jgi:outer membrane protein OmpA-like peptidoglycan-associated protein
VPSYDRVDLNVSWNNFLQQPIDLSFFMTNALDKTYEVGAVTNYGQIGTSTLIYSEPRMFGFSVKYRFGGPYEEPPAEPAAYTPPPAVAPAPAVAKSYLVFFDFNKSDLTPQAQTIVDQAARNAGAEKVTRLTVTGHTDTVGSDAYNMRLSRRRAESVAAQLEKDGIPSSEIAIIAKGKRDLLVPTADGVREPQNRRVQIVYSDGAGS